jgi:methionine-rich copper-binding protein CopC
LIGYAEAVLATLERVAAMRTRTASGTPHAAIPLLAILVAAIALQLFTTSPAMAHTRLVSSSPAQGAGLDRLPDVVTLKFSEGVRQPAALTVTGPGGEEISTGKTAVETTTLSRPLDKSTEPQEGAYTVNYQVTSADGHLISGTVRFTLSRRRATPTTHPTIGNDAVQSPATVNRKLVSSSPANGAKLSSLPEVAVLNFSEVVRLPATLTVTGPDGDEISTADASVVDATLLRPLDTTTELREGAYTMRYRVTAADGQPKSGTVRFTLSRAPAVPAVAPVAATADSSIGSSSRPGAVAGLVVGLAAALGLAVFSIRELMRHDART